MILFLCAQDLGFFWIGLMKNDSFEVIEKKEVFPEVYLSEVDVFLTQQQIKLTDLAGISVVTGPGSFTASRISLTIANTLHFTHQLPLFILKNEERLEPKELIVQSGIGEPLRKGDYAHVFYDRAPHITQPTQTIE